MPSQVADFKFCFSKNFKKKITPRKNPSAAPTSVVTYLPCAKKVGEMAKKNKPRFDCICKYKTYWLIGFFKA